MEQTYNGQKINIQEFNSLPISEQAIMLWGQGMFLELWCEQGKYKVGIYLLYGSLVSVNYNISTGRIDKIIMFDRSVEKEHILKNIPSN